MFLYLASFVAYDVARLCFVSRAMRELMRGHDWDTQLKQWWRARLLPCDLALRNAHDRDWIISFEAVRVLWEKGGDASEEEEVWRFVSYDVHRYTLMRWDMERQQFWVRKTGALYKSATTWIKEQFPVFMDDLVITKMMASRNWSRSKYFGMTRDAIKAQWKQTRDEASAAGTAMHENIENFLNGRPYDASSREFELFLYYQAALDPDMEIYRSEWCVYDSGSGNGKNEGMALCGSIDAAYTSLSQPFDEAGKRRIWIADWKRTREWKTSNKWDKGTSELTCEDDDCNAVHYAYQPRNYALVLQRNYGCVVQGHWDTLLHPQQNDFIRHDIPVDPTELARIVKYRVREVQRHLAQGKPWY